VTGDPISYQDWGADFFRIAVSEERILGAVRQLAGRPIEFGPLGVGPGRLAQVTAKGDVGEPTCEPIAGDHVAFRIQVPAHVEFDLDLGVNKPHFSVDLVIPIVATARAMPDLVMAIDARPPTPSELEMKVRAHGLSATFVSAAADVEGELRKFVAKFVAREINKPEVVAARTIDVRSRLDRAWKA